MYKKKAFAVILVFMLLLSALGITAMAADMTAEEIATQMTANSNAWFDTDEKY